MELERYMLQLNRTQLLFIPPLDLACGPNSSSGTVVQVCLRGELGEGYMRSLLEAGATNVCLETYPTSFPSSKHPSR